MKPQREKHQAFYNLLDAFSEGCPFCSLIKKNIHKYMDDFLYESVNDPGLRKEVRRSLGFCNRHAWQLQKFNDGFSTAIVYEEVLRDVIHGLEGSEGFSSIFKSFVHNEASDAGCVICKEEKDTEQRYLSVFIENFMDAELQARYTDSFGLCFPHFLDVLKHCKNQEIVKQLIACELKKTRSLHVEIKEFLRKQDYRFSKEGFGHEKDSWIRAIEKVLGKEGVHIR